MRTNLLRVAVVVAFALAYFAALRVADHFIPAPSTPGLVLLLFGAIWIPALRWWYRNEPQPAIDPRRRVRLLLASLAACFAIGAAGIAAAALILPSSIAQPCDPAPR